MMLMKFTKKSQWHLEAELVDAGIMELWLLVCSFGGGQRARRGQQLARAGLAGGPQMVKNRYTQSKNGGKTVEENEKTLYVDQERRKYSETSKKNIMRRANMVTT